MPRSITLSPEPLTAEAFAPFGDVVEARAARTREANQGTARRHDHLARFESARPKVEANLAIFESRALSLPLPLRLFERHAHSSQLFLPMVAARYLVVVAPHAADGGPDFDNARAFLAGPAQGVNYRAGVWHHPIVALESDATFAMLAWEDGGAEDAEERALPRAMIVTA
jgi:ureidoglycolate lyase